MKTITIVFSDGKEEKFSCDNWRVEEGLLRIFRRGCPSYYYPIAFLHHFEVAE